MALVPPTFQDILRAQSVIRQYLHPTPLLNSAALSEYLGFNTWVKCENLQPIGAFKIRGGIYLMSRLSEEERAAGVVTASSGNHGQSIAYAAKLFGIRAAVYAPENCNPVKAASMRRLGAELVLEGRDFDESREAAAKRAEADGMRFIHSANEPDLIAGVGTYALEIIEQVPDLDTIIVPIGAGSGICGSSIVMKTVNPEIQVIGVQTEALPVVERSWREHRLVELESGTTFADGLATRVAFELPLQIIHEHVDDIRLVSEDALCHSIVTLIENARLVAEGAGAAALAAAEQMREELTGKNVALILSGGNITLETLNWAMERATQYAR